MTCSGLYESIAKFLHNFLLPLIVKLYNIYYYGINNILSARSGSVVVFGRNECLLTYFQNPQFYETRAVLLLHIKI